VTIGVIWANHHTVIGQISHREPTFLVINTLFLMVVAFIPFPTHLLSEYILDPENAQAAAVVYGITGTLVAVMFNIMWRYARQRAPLLASRAPTPAHARSMASAAAHLPGPFLYAAATAVAFAWESRR
jgi:uncharacterized membrane protein